MSKDDRSSLNPFTGKEHLDKVNDDEFLNECYNQYYNEVNQYELLDNTPDGQAVFKIVSNLVHTVEDYLNQIGRIDYVAGYYDWEVHLVNSNIANACCYPGGKIIVYAGILSYIEYIEELAFILSHEISHALLDHSRTAASAQQTKNAVSQATWLGSIALDLLGMGGAAELTRAAVNIADISSHYFLTKPWGRDQELEADKLGLIIGHLAGYDMSVVPQFWQKFSQENNNEHDFFSTHPSDDKRIAVMRESLMETIQQQNFLSGPLLPETPKAKSQYKTENIEKEVRQKESVYKMCPNCGGQTKANSNFCMHCGYQF